MLRKVKNKVDIASENIRLFMTEEDGMGTIEIILIIVVLIGLVIIFKSQITGVVNSVFGKINDEIAQF